MIDRREILEAASSFSLLPNIVEKDYVLGWILAGINAHEEPAEGWVFKGGGSDFTIFATHLATGW
jgi:predicted nucleotidyltransferase component of viral defense system